jgi:hypothetical protein
VRTDFVFVGVGSIPEIDGAKDTLVFENPFLGIISLNIRSCIRISFKIKFAEKTPLLIFPWKPRP